MIKHVVLIKLKDGYDKQLLATLTEELNALPEQIPQIVSFSHGQQANVLEGKYDYGLVAEFANKEDCMTYLTHPAHAAVGTKMREVMADAATMQFNS